MAPLADLRSGYGYARGNRDAPLSRLRNPPPPPPRRPIPTRRYQDGREPTRVAIRHDLNAFESTSIQYGGAAPALGPRGRAGKADPERV